jgi:cysteine desulfurase
MIPKVYLDNAATTKVDPRVMEAMLPYFSNVYGNASSLHSFGTEAKEAIETARSVIANLVNSRSDEIYFTSGGTESNNLAIKGIAFANKHKGNHIIVSAIEHDCILSACKWLEQQGFYISYLPVDNEGIVISEVLKKSITPQTILVSVMHANNEIGTIQPLQEIGKICKEHSVLFHTDACQSFGKIPFDVSQSLVDIATINSHKIYGPKGVGALYLRKGIRLSPLFHGGGQELGLRSSTENIPGIAGFAKAAQLCFQEQTTEALRLKDLRKRISDFLFDTFDNAYINGHPDNRLPGHLNFSFQGLEGETIRLLLLLDEMGIAVSAGSACSSNHGFESASHVLKAIGRNDFEARGAVRISLGRFNTDQDIDIFQHAIKQNMTQLNTIFSR